MRHIDFHPQQGRVGVRFEARVIIRAEGSGRGCLVTPELKLSCVQSSQWLVTRLSQVRDG